MTALVIGDIQDSDIKFFINAMETREGEMSTGEKFGLSLAYEVRRMRQEIRSFANAKNTLETGETVSARAVLQIVTNRFLELTPDADRVVVEGAALVFGKGLQLEEIAVALHAHQAATMVYDVLEKQALESGGDIKNPQRLKNRLIEIFNENFVVVPAEMPGAEGKG